ncbi:hypothetical protein B0H14DRAFT_3477492 [Mycena olivaceomarginata]|nr:hypothetical protein B0H14DRAFT_3477492 [Mycena olivaceomarginata]
MSTPPTQKCSSCKCQRPLEFFDLQHGVRRKTCRACLLKKNPKRHVTQKENNPTHENAGPVEDDPEDDSYLSIVTLEDLPAAIAMDENARSLGALIDASAAGQTGKGLADTIALEIQQCIGYRFIYHSKYEQKNTDLCPTAPPASPSAASLNDHRLPGRRAPSSTVTARCHRQRLAHPAARPWPVILYAVSSHDHATPTAAAT